MIEEFKEIINFKELLQDNVTYEKGSNSTFSVECVLDFIIDCLIKGNTRFLHMEDMRNDAVYINIKGYELPSEKVCRDTIDALPKETINELKRVNQKLLELKSKNQEPREITLNFDDTVCTVFGEQEGAEKGYNPEYKGRKSFKEKIAIIADTNELINTTLEEGSKHSNFEFLEFFKECEKGLPKNWYIKRIRADRGMFDQENFKYFEEQSYEYVVKGNMQNNTRKILEYINKNEEQYEWLELEKSFLAFNEITMALPTWTKARRMIFIRKKIRNKKLKKGNINYENLYKYEYQVIVTNIDYMTPKEIFDEYNQRCNVENNIDELKSGFGISQNSRKIKKNNEILLVLKMIAFNLNRWFQEQILPEDMKKHEIQTLRRVLYNICGELKGGYYCKYIKFPNYTYLIEAMKHILSELKCFSNSVRLL